MAARRAFQLTQLSLLLALTAVCAVMVSRSQKELTSRTAQFQNDPSEALYLPNEDAVNLVSFGYRNVLANYLWFRTINYFGKHYAGDQDYRWLHHMCNLVTNLDRKSRHVYEFCSTMLAWEVDAPKEAHALLTKAIASESTYWKYYYLRGFVSLYFLNNKEEAKQDFVTASQLPEVHSMVVRLAAKSLAVQDDPEEAIDFLQSTLRTTSDPIARNAILERLKELAYERDLRKLEAATARFQEAQKKLPSSIQEIAPYLESSVSLSDPYGGEYIFDVERNIVRSTSNHRRLGRKQ